MSGINDNLAIIGDWMPPSPSPRSFFSAMLGEENGSRSIPEPVAQNETDNFFSPPKDKSLLVNMDRRNTALSDNFAELGPFSELRSSNRGGLMDRIAARAGFNAPKLNTEGIRPNDILNPDGKSTFLMLSPGLSPTTLLESPVFLSNSLAQPSPTTGKFQFVPNGSNRSSRLVDDGPDRSKDNNLFEDNDSSSFAFKPITESSPSFFGSEPKAFPQQSFPRMEVSAQSDASIKPHNAEEPKFHFQADFSRPLMEKDMVGHNNNNSENIPSDQRMLDRADHSSPVDEPQDEEGDQKGNGDPTMGGGGVPSEDGYNWRKYGQKQVKGSEYPRSYYKCTHPNCQVKKKVERSHEGDITEIIYKGAHNHPKPPPNRRGFIGGPDMPEQGQGGIDVDQGWVKSFASEWKQDSLEVASSPSGGPEFVHSNSNAVQQGQSGGQLEPSDAVDASSTFSNEEGEDDQVNGSASLGYDAEEDETESKRRKIEIYPTDMSGATRAIREPRVVVQTTSEVDILDDGYRWRKYGQKVVKGNPNPRSYYKCTSPGCTVRKHVERASHDLKSVITTYEGKHNHDVPAARNSSHGNNNNNSGPGSAQPVGSTIQAHLHRPEPGSAHNGITRFDRPGGPLGSFRMPPNGFSFGMNGPHGLANFSMPMMPIHPFLAAQAAQQQQQSRVNEMGFVPSRVELKPEPVSETSGLNLSNNNSSAYQQFMSRLPLGPQM